MILYGTQTVETSKVVDLMKLKVSEYPTMLQQMITPRMVRIASSDLYPKAKLVAMLTESYNAYQSSKAEDLFL